MQLHNQTQESTLGGANCLVMQSFLPGDTLSSELPCRSPIPFSTQRCLRFLPESLLVVLVKDVSPGVDIHHPHSPSDHQHEGELDHVADLDQHNSGDQRQHSDVAVVFGVLHTGPHRQFQYCTIDDRVILLAAELRRHKRTWHWAHLQLTDRMPQYPASNEKEHLFSKEQGDSLDSKTYILQVVHVSSHTPVL